MNPVTKQVTVGVPYSQSKWALENGSVPPTSTPYAGYRTDCSGFASLCWNLKNSSGKPYSTSTYEMGKNNSPYFKLTAIRQSDLQPGDLILKSKVWYTGSGGGHAIIFAGWSKSDKSEYWALEQTSPGTKYSRRPYGQTGYRPFRFNGVEGFNRTRVTYGGTFTVDGTAYRAPGAAGSVVATDGVIDLVRYGSDGSVTPRGLERARGSQRSLLGHPCPEDDRTLRGSIPERGHGVPDERVPRYDSHGSPQSERRERQQLEAPSEAYLRLLRRREPASRLKAVGLQVQQQDPPVPHLQDSEGFR